MNGLLAKQVKNVICFRNKRFNERGGHWALLETAKPNKKSSKTTKLQKNFDQNRRHKNSNIKNPNLTLLTPEHQVSSYTFLTFLFSYKLYYSNSHFEQETELEKLKTTSNTKSEKTHKPHKTPKPKNHSFSGRKPKNQSKK